MSLGSSGGASWELLARAHALLAADKSSTLIGLLPCCRRTVQSSGDLGTCSPREGIDLFSNNDLTAVKTASADACCEHCQQNPICWAWSFVTKEDW